MYQIKSKFFGREGGVSQPPYSSLNCGLGSGDEIEDIKKNRTRVAEQMGVTVKHLLTVNQIHSADVVTVTAPWTDAPPKADAMVTNKPNLALGILTADCAPVLFQDEKNGVIGAAHAGWRGAFSGVLENTVQAMENLGAERNQISFQIGPCIAQNSYEVSAEFYQNFLTTNPDWQRFFLPGARPDHYQFDLPGFVAARLTAFGIRNAAPDRPENFDTCGNEQAYFSYRRMTLRKESDYGRQISVILLQS